MTLGASAVRGNHDDQALSAYRKLRRFGRKVLLVLASGNPVFCTLLLLPIHAAVCLAYLHARVLLCLFAPASMLTAICTVSMHTQGRGRERGGARGSSVERGNARSHGESNTMMKRHAWFLVSTPIV